MIEKIHWRITDICNYSCDYCFHYNSIKKNVIISDEDIYTACMSLKNKVSESKLEISIVGGEPTIDKNLNNKIRIINEILKPTKLTISTNGFDIKNIDENVFINYSIHQKYYNKKNILDNLKYLKNHRYKILIMVDENLDAKFFNLLEKTGYKCEYYKILKDDKLIEYSGINYSRNFHNVKDKNICKLNNKMLIIHLDGKCKLSLCNQSKYLDGNLYNSTLEFLERDQIICNEVFCSSWNIL